ncbi:MAG: trigger factor [Pyrinomonadaceae bacterium]|nr:trigger factor [Pyrinomonadaceae bacterium]
MNTELINVSETNKEIRIEIPPEQVREVYDSVSKKYADQAQVPGFRKGLAPLDVIRMRFQEEIKSEVIQEILPPRVTEAIQKHELSPLAEPHLHLEDPENVKVNGSQPLAISVHVQVMPQIPEPKYEGLEATRRIKPVTDEQIENIIDEKRQQQSTLIPAEDRKSKDGDMVIVDLKGTFLDDETADPIEVNDLEVPLGDEVVEKSFSDNLVGVEEGDEREFTVEYPAEFSSPALAGRNVKYKALVKSVGVVELPDLDDDWVASLDEEFKSVKELKAGLRKDLEAMAKSDADSRIRNDLIAKLIEGQSFEVPEALIESQAQSLLNNFAQDLAQRGVDLSKVEKDFVETTYNQMKGQAERDVRGAMLLERIADVEKIEISKDSVEQEIELMAQQYQTTTDEIRRSLDEQGGVQMIENNLRTRAAVEALAEKAKITDGEWIDESSQQPGADETEPSEPTAEKETKKKTKKKDKKGKKSSKKKSKD